MPKGSPPAWTQRDCRFDYVVEAVTAAGGGPFTYQGIETPERAKDIKQGVYRCGHHRGVSPSVMWLHSGRETRKSADWPPDRQPDGTYQLIITIYAKGKARKHQVTVHGPDRTKWDYNPRAPKSQADVDAWAAKGLNEKGHRIK